VIRVWAFSSVIALTFGCASSVHELWPPQEATRAHTIIVSLDTWHAMIAFPQETQAEQPGGRPLFEEWGYAEQGWYLKGRQGLQGVLRALLWPSPGVVEVGLHHQVWSERTPQPPSQGFTFQLSEEGYRRLRYYLQSTIASHEPVLASEQINFYPAAASYHLLHHCHHYTAQALSEAGLPISVFWAFNRGSFAFQLRRAERLAAEAEARSGS